MLMTKPLPDARIEAYRRVMSEDGIRPIAFVAVLPEQSVPGVQGGLGIAVANEAGYTPIPLAWARFESFEAAQEDADRINKALGLDADRAFAIIASTMGGKRFAA